VRLKLEVEIAFDIGVGKGIGDARGSLGIHVAHHAIGDPRVAHADDLDGSEETLN